MSDMAAQCTGGQVPECPVIDALFKMRPVGRSSAPEQRSYVRRDYRSSKSAAADFDLWRVLPDAAGGVGQQRVDQTGLRRQIVAQRVGIAIIARDVVQEPFELGKTFIGILVSAHLILQLGPALGVAGRPEACSHDYE